jgi:glycosyltransferase involved in cell wall biosynthesis
VFKIPLISVVIPVFNREKYLTGAIKSVLAQEYPRLEIIIVDDGSTDQSATIAKSFQEVRYFFQKNGGPAAARNKGIMEAKGDVLAFIDSDDLWTSDKIAVQLQKMKEDPSLQMILGRIQYFRETHQQGEGETDMEWLQDPIVAVNFGNALIKRPAFEKVGLLDISLTFGEDMDWFLRAREKEIPTFFQKEVTLLYRKHEENMCNDIKKMNSFLLKSFKKSLLRRRQTSPLKKTDLPNFGNLHDDFGSLGGKND